MPIKINGTNTAANPSITGDDTDTGIVYGSDQLDFSIGGTSKATLDSSGNLGIGTADTDDDKLLIQADNDNNSGLTVKGGSSQGRTSIKVQAGNATSGSITAFRLKNSSGTSIGSFHMDNATDDINIMNSSQGGNIFFHTNESGSSLVKMTIKDDGRIAVGSDATPNNNANITANKFQATAGTGMIGIVSNQTAHPDDTNNIPALARSISGGVTRQCYIGTRKVGTANCAGFLYIQQRDGGNSHIWADNNAKIRTSNNSAQIGAAAGTIVGTQTSDIRLKNNLGSVSYGLTEINKITPIKYTFKKDETSRQQIGFSAQDIQSIIPESVYDTEETVEVEGVEVKNTLAMEYVALVPVLVNAVKELSAEVTTLKTKVAALEAA